MENQTEKNMEHDMGSGRTLDFTGFFFFFFFFFFLGGGGGHGCSDRGVSVDL